MDPIAVLFAVVAAVAIAAVIFVGVRLNRLRREVDTVLDRLSERGGNTGSRRPGIYRAVRELERDLESTRNEAALLRVAFDRAEIGIVIAGPNRAMVFTNPAADAVMQGRLGEGIARERVLQLVDRVTRTGVGETLELDLFTPARRILNLTAVPLPAEGGDAWAAVVYIIDLTERYRVEAMRRDFVSNASHELKTPLGALSLLAETLVEAKDEEMRLRLAQRLQSEANRMANVIDDVLVLAETESLGGEHTEVSIPELLERAASALADVAARQGIDIVRGKLESATIQADRQQLASAFENLLNNAITYTAAKQEPGTVWYRCQVEDGSARIEVEDTGIGIPDRYVDRVFERFFRVDRARSRESGGTGLGLSIVRNVAIAHGGTAAVRSQVGVGSTFTITLPVVQEDTR